MESTTKTTAFLLSISVLFFSPQTALGKERYSIEATTSFSKTSTQQYNRTIKSIDFKLYQGSRSLYTGPLQEYAFLTRSSYFRVGVNTIEINSNTSTARIDSNSLLWGIFSTNRRGTILSAAAMTGYATDNIEGGGDGKLSAYGIRAGQYINNDTAITVSYTVTRVSASHASYQSVDIVDTSLQANLKTLQQISNTTFLGLTLSAGIYGKDDQIKDSSENGNTLDISIDYYTSRRTSYGLQASSSGGDNKSRSFGINITTYPTKNIGLSITTSTQYPDNNDTATHDTELTLIIRV